jgi:predicted ATPase
MRLRALTVENFRGYLEPTTIAIADFTSIIGCNDVGKSTLLDALEIFFNGGKPDADDAHINGRGQPTRIACQFDELPPTVIIDSRMQTTLTDEYLLNAAGNLEIIKEYDLSVTKIDAKVFARANHPAVDGGEDLLQLNNTELKARAQERSINLNGIDQRVNTDIRRLIWNGLGDLVLQERLIPLNNADAKEVWMLLQKEMPTFALFRADRQSRDDDDEVTNPFDTAIKDAVKSLETELNAIKEKVQEKVEEVAKRTLDKLREMDPRLAEELRPEFKTEPKWASFKLSLTDHRDIPINKRGSGVRRIILLNFFRAESERRQRTSNAPGIIYAVEEPESSQHPSNQRLLINALLELSAAERTQVIITTHVPGIAALIPEESVRYVQHDDNRHPRVMSNDEDVLRRVADQLGVLPDKRVKLLLYVEGPTDVSFLKYVSRLTGQIDLATDPRIAFVVTGGGTLGHWVNQRYLQGLSLREIHIYDRDNDRKYQEYVDEVNHRGNGDWATLTTRREIENYLHPQVVQDTLGIRITFDDDDDVPLMVARAIHEASESQKPWNEVEDKKQKGKISKAKRRLCCEVVAQMSGEQLKECDQAGEIEGWLNKITQALSDSN